MNSIVALITKPPVAITIAVILITLIALKKDRTLKTRLTAWLFNTHALNRHPVKLFVEPGNDGTEPDFVKRKPSGCHQIIVVLLLGFSMFLCFSCFTGRLFGKFWEQPAAVAQEQTTEKFSPTPPATATVDWATHTPLPTYTALPTYTPQPTDTPIPTATPIATYTPQPTYTPLPTYTPIDAPTATPTASATAPVEKLNITKLEPLQPLSDTAPLTKSLIITVTATVTPTALPMWDAWHVVHMDVRDMADRRDGSTEVRHILIDAHGNFTHSLDIKCRMSNAENDLRVNEPKSQKVLIHAGVPAYTFYIGQGGSTWDVQFYEYKTESQAVDISELLKLPVGKNQLVEVYWEFGACPVVQHAQVNPGAGTDNGRSAPQRRATQPTEEVIVAKTVIVVTATPQPVPTSTPWIIYVPYQPTATVTPNRFPRWTVTPYPTFALSPTETPLPPPATATPSPYPPPATATPSPYPPPTTLSPLSDSATAARARMRVYLPLAMK